MTLRSLNASGVRLSALLLSLVLYGCQANSPDLRNQSAVNSATPSNSNASGLLPVALKEKLPMAQERINGLTYDGEKVRFNVLSNGCTAPEDFRIDTVPDTDTCLITIVRTKPDLCKKATAPTVIEIDWAKPAECLDYPLVVTNPLLEDKPRDASGLLPGAIK